MLSDTDKNLIKYRLEQAADCIKAAEDTIASSLKTSVNRSYYGILHSMRAVLAMERFDSKKHQGVISAFRQRYIKTGKIAAQYSDIIHTAFTIRNNCDYQDFYIVAESDARQQLENARDFYKTVCDFLDNEIIDS